MNLTKDINNIAIIGAGPAGVLCAYFASSKHNVTLFDFAKPLHTLLYTGGGRCNLAHAEYDFKELAKFYPRGEKFLYSVFSQFCTGDTLNYFQKIGVETYTQDDYRIFPTSDSAKDVREKMLKSISHCGIKREKVIGIKPNDEQFSIKTVTNTYDFDKVVIAIGGHSGFELAGKIGHKIIEPKPSLTSLITKENFKPLQGVSLKNIEAQIFYDNKLVTTLNDDLLFTHQGISGPLAYKISSLCARFKYNKQNPLKITLNLLKEEINLQNLLNENSKKDVKNLLADFVPKSLAECITTTLNLPQKCHQIDGKTRDLILKTLTEFQVNAISPAKDGEVVTSGGVCLDEINPKTMESKLIKGLYFCGEVIDVDGFCGGYNLQNCWSTGYVSAINL